MKSELAYVLAALILSLSCLCLGTAQAQPGPPYFIDDFEDGSATDGMPVTWVPIPTFATGSRDVVNGEYVLTPEAATIGTEMDSEVAGLVFGDVSLRTLVRSGPENWVGIYGRSNFVGPSGGSVSGGFRTDGLLFIATSTNTSNDILDSQSLAHGLANEDVHLQLDIFGTDLSLTMWLDGDDKPSMPQLNAPIPFSPSEGTIGVAVIPTGTQTLSPVAFDFIAAVPEPGALVLTLAGMLGFLRFRRREVWKQST